MPQRRLFTAALLLIATLLGAAPASAQTTYRVYFEARLVEDGASVEKGLEWRIFGSKIGEDGKLPLLANAVGGTRTFKMSAGQYLVHASYGHASALRKVEIGPESSREILILDAGGLSLSAVAGEDTPIPANMLRFDVYAAKQDDRGQRQLIARQVRAGEIIPFPAGTYHVVSSYGDLNAEIRADIRVRPGKVTKARLKHRAAHITLRLVRASGGDALANTQWSVLNESGDLITESTSAFPRIVLSEGTYTAIAKNNERIFSEDFTVTPGLNRDVEVLVEG